MIGEARWRGQPGFFEIWFLVVFAPSRRRAWWLRYTTWSPRVGPPRATLWAAAFDGDARPLVRKALFGIGEYTAPNDGWARIGDAHVGPGVARGRIGDLAWDLAFATTVPPQGPAWVHRLPAPTRVEHLASGASAGGWIERAGAREALVDGHVIAKHIWGTRRVEELYWVWCPALEATQVRLRAGRGPRLATVRCDDRDMVLRTRIVPDGPGVLHVDAIAATRRVHATARCDPATLAGWAYRDPAGWDVLVAQSDVATCSVELWTRAHPFAGWGEPRRFAPVQAAVEFHQREPLRGVRYLAWDEEGFA